MKNYLYFSPDGELEELKTKSKIYDSDDYTEYKYIETIEYNKYNFIILFNKNENEKINLTSLPFYNKNINGPFLLLALDKQNNFKSLTQKKFLQLISKDNFKKHTLNTIEDYSSDDFNLSDD
tara:strand:+ start:8530 stop:8895 length:366 start_codon:yes stop_codon:yes gene_type:complete